jgi:hypothetical protein
MQQTHFCTFCNNIQDQRVKDRSGVVPQTSKAFLVGSGQHWQAVIKDKDNNWNIMEKTTQHAVQNLHTMLQNKAKAGAVYQLVDSNENTDTRKRLREESASTQSPTESLPTSPQVAPPDKRQFSFSHSCHMQFALVQNSRLPLFVQATPPANFSSAPMQLPEDFQADPQFKFQPPVT